MEHTSDDERSSVFIRVHRMAKFFYSEIILQRRRSCSLASDGSVGWRQD